MKKTILALLTLLACLAAPLPAEIMTYQGRLKDNSLPANGNYAFSFDFCDAAQTACFGSTDNPQNFLVANGLFKSTFTMPSVNLAAQAWYLRVSVGGAVLSPLERLTAVPYSVYASSAGYSPAAVQKAGSVMSGQLTLAGSTLTVTGNAFSVGGSTLAVTNGNVGIGTAVPNPYAKLHILTGGTPNLENITLESPATNVGFALKFVQPEMSWAVGQNIGNYPDGRFQVMDLNTATARLTLLRGGNLGVGAADPAYRLTVSSGAGEAGNMVVISTGASEVIRMTGGGEVYATRFIGDGSGITGVTGAVGVDASKLPLSGGTLTGQLTLAGSTLTVSGGAFSVGRSTFVVNGGRVGVGEDSLAASSTPFHVAGAGAVASFRQYAAAPAGGNILLQKSRGTTIGSNLIVQDGDTLGQLSFQGSSGDGSYPNSAAIVASVDGNVSGPSDIPGRLSFWTSQDGSATVVEKMRLDNQGRLGINTTAPLSTLHVVGDVTASGPVTAQSTLTVTGSDFSVGESTFVVQAGKVGINVASPQRTLQVGTVGSWLTSSGVLIKGSNPGIELSDTQATPQRWVITNGVTAANDGKMGLVYDATLGVARVTVLPGTGYVGIGTEAPQARLDVHAEGSGGTTMAQIWRNSAGAVVSSVSATGVMMGTLFVGDGSGLTNVAAATGVDNSKLPLAGGLMAGNIAMGGYQIYLVSTITASGDITAARYQIDGSTVLAIGGTPTIYSLLVGRSAGLNNPASNFNTLVGNSAGRGGGGATFNRVTAVGQDAGFSLVSGGHNSLMGVGAGYLMNTGEYNTVVGALAAYSDTQGSHNVAVGAKTSYFSSSGSSNTVVGDFAGYGVTANSYSDNSLFGANAGYGLMTGSRNILIGRDAGRSLTTGSDNIVIGTGQDTSWIGAGSELNIGGVLFGKLDEKAVGISTRVPGAALDIVSTATAAAVYAQFWRDGTGNIVSSMSSTGFLKAVKFIGDGSGLTGVSGVDSSKLPLAGGTLTGYLGLGTGSPQHYLHLSSNTSASSNTLLKLADTGTGAPQLLLEAGGHQGRMATAASNGGTYIGTLTNDFLVFETNSAERLKIAADGKIGTGGIVPAEALDIASRVMVSTAVGGNTATDGLLSYGTNGMKFQSNGSTYMFAAYGGGNVSIGSSVNSGAGDAKLQVKGSLAVGAGITGHTGDGLVVQGRVGVGTAAPSGLLEVRDITSVNKYLLVLGTGSAGGFFTVSTSGVVGLGYGTPSTNTVLHAQAVATSFTIGEDVMAGLTGSVRAVGTGSEDVAVGGDFRAEADGNQNLAYLAGLHTAVERTSAGSGVVGNAVGLFVDVPRNGSFPGGFTNTYGVYIDTQTSGNQTNAPYALYSVDKGARAFFAGRVGIGADAPRYALEVSSAAGSAQDILAVSTGTDVVFRVTGNGDVHSGRFFGNGAGLTNISGTDASKLPLAGGTLAGPLTVNSSSITVNSTAANPFMILNSDNNYGALEFRKNTTTLVGHMGFANTGGLVIPSIPQSMALTGYNGLHLGVGSVTLLTMTVQNKIGLGNIISPAYSLDVSTANDTDGYVARFGANGILVSTGGAVQTTGVGNGSVAGDARGNGAVDLQTRRDTADQVASGPYSTIGGGLRNSATYHAATVAGGQSNKALFYYATVAGGNTNTAGGHTSVVAGGASNSASGIYSAVVGGDTNKSLAANSFTGGGQYNVVSGSNSVIAGGAYNTVRSTSAVIAGGENNTLNSVALWGTIAGGRNNQAGGIASFVGGGHSNTANYNYAAIGGGWGNITGATADYAFLGGGYSNQVNGVHAALGGGWYNVANGMESFIGAGGYNTADPQYSVIVGGLENKIRPEAYAGFIGGGAHNISTAPYSVVGGGLFNTSSGTYSGVLAGSRNEAIGGSSFVGGGSGNTARGVNSMVGGGSGNTANDPGTVVGGGVSNIANESFSFVGGGYQNNAATGYTAIAGGYQNTIGTAGGFGAYSFIGGGYGNDTQTNLTVITGGESNTIANPGQYGVIGGGYRNRILDTRGAILGGEANLSTAPYSVVGGGLSNTSSGTYSGVLGGHYNVAAAVGAAVAGGGRNYAGGQYSVVPGGADNFAGGLYSFSAGYRSTTTMAGSFTWNDNFGDSLINQLPNTVMFKASGGFWVSTGTVFGTPGLMVNTLNDVGMGTAGPAKALHIKRYGSVPDIRLERGFGGETWDIGGNTGTNFNISQGGTNNLTVEGGAGRVGIAHSPVANSARLQVNGDVGLGDGTKTGNQPVVVWLQNNFAGDVSSGSIVVVAAPGAFTTTTSAGSASAIGVVYEPGGIVSGTVGRVAVTGMVRVRCNGTAAIGQHVTTSGVNGEAASAGFPTSGTSIGVWMEACTSPAMGWVVLR